MSEPEEAARIIAFHLPQFHPIPENDQWWGRGFTEWTNVTRARPLFEGHYQPHLPADLGYYDLRLPEARLAQAKLAGEYGIHGFCYYHYWFNGRRILERPFNDILSSGEPDFPFCLCWANENWTRRWDGQEAEILLAQVYSEEDDEAHIRSFLPAFHDRRYLKVEDRPLFLVYRSSRLPNPQRTAERWRRAAERGGAGGLYLVQVESFHEEMGDPRDIGFDASLEFQPRWFGGETGRIPRRKWWHRARLRTAEPGFVHNNVYQYDELVEKGLALAPPAYPWIRCVCPSWDNSPRRKRGAAIFIDSTPQKYERWLREIVTAARAASGPRSAGRPLVFVNAWNEWAEGNHLEPCQRWGRAYLEATRRALQGLPGGR